MGPVGCSSVSMMAMARPILKAEPMIQTRQLGPDDRFVIFGSHGFWDEISNEEAATSVRNCTRDVSATLGPDDRVVICFSINLSVFGFMYFLVPVENYSMLS